LTVTVPPDPFCPSPAVPRRIDEETPSDGGTQRGASLLLGIRAGF